jgi:hypothetical protein
MDKAGPAAGILAALALVAYVGFSGGLVNLVFGEEPEIAFVDPDLLAAHVGLSHPLPYDVSIMQSGYGITEPRTRYLVGYRLELK